MRFRQTKEGYWMPVDYTDKSAEQQPADIADKEEEKLTDDADPAGADDEPAEQQPASDENIIDDDDKRSKPKASKK